jgi:uncharacterized protein (DUF433 family)
MTDAELAQLLERLARLENEVKQLTAMVKQLAAPGGEPQTVREQGEAYTTEGKLIKQTNHPHIVRIPEVQNGTPLIRGPYKTVWGIVELFKRGLTVEQIIQAIQEEQGVTLMLTQVYDALSFYFDNKAEIDATLAEKQAELEKSVEGYLKMKFGPKDPNPTPPQPLPPSEPKPVIETDHPYIIRIPGKSGGEPLIREAYKTVRGIVELTWLGMTPQQIVDDYGGELTLAQVYDALSYYHHHREEMDVVMARHAAADDYGRRLSYQEQVAYAKRKREMNAR